MVHPCDKPCGNKTENGYCATTACINPQFSNIGTAQYGQDDPQRIYYIDASGRTYANNAYAEFKKTGRHFPIAELLVSMGVEV